VAGGELAGGRELRVTMQGELMQLAPCEAAPAFDQVLAQPHELHGCRLERRLGDEPELVGYIDAAKPVRDEPASVDVALRLDEGADTEWRRMVAPDALSAAQWLLALVAGAADLHKMLQGKNTARLPAVSLRSVLTNSYRDEEEDDEEDRSVIATSKLRCDADHNDSTQETVWLAVSLRDVHPEGALFEAQDKSSKTVVYACLHYVREGSKRKKLFETERLEPRESCSNRSLVKGSEFWGVDFSVLLGCTLPADTSTDSLTIEVWAKWAGKLEWKQRCLGSIALTFAQLRAANEQAADIKQETRPPADDGRLRVQPRLRDPNALLGTELLLPVRKRGCNISLLRSGDRGAI
jgi:hypothetical protein